MVKTKKQKECGICCDTIKGHNTEIVCKYCNFACCKNCSKTYILSIINTARCMNNDCDKIWDREFLIDQFKYTFVNTDYKKHRQNLLYDLEVAKFQETLAIIESRKEIDAVIEKIAELRKQKNNIIIDYNAKEVEEKKRVIRHYRRNNYQPQFHYHNDLNYQIKYLEGLLKLKKDLKVALNEEDPEKENKIKQRDKLNSEIYKLERKKYEMKNGQQKTKKVKYFGHCPAPDCKGFINANFKCGLCDIIVCRTCRVKIADKGTPEKELAKIKKDHECNEDDVASMMLIKKETKPCPKCKIPIIRSMGCRQMWCTECHVAFDWQTGEIAITNHIHNPHYLEWKRKNGIQTDNDQCLNRNQLDWYRISRKFDSLSRSDYCYLQELVYFARDIRYRIINNLNNKVNADKNLELRILFLKNKITEKEFKKKLQIREKEVSKLRDHAMIYDMFETSFQEFLLKYVNDMIIDQNGKKLKRTGTWVNQEFVKFKETIEKLINYTNESFQKLTIIYKNKVPQLEREDKTRSVYCQKYNDRGYVDFNKFKIGSK